MLLVVVVVVGCESDDQIKNIIEKSILLYVSLKLCIVVSVNLKYENGCRNPECC